MKSVGRSWRQAEVQQSVFAQSFTFKDRKDFALERLYGLSRGLERFDGARSLKDEWRMGQFAAGCFRRPETYDGNGDVIGLGGGADKLADAGQDSPGNLIRRLAAATVQQGEAGRASPNRPPRGSRASVTPSEVVTIKSPG